MNDDATQDKARSTDGLGPLPEPRVLDRHLPTGYVILGYSAEGMRAYGEQRAAAESERCIHLRNALLGLLRHAERMREVMGVECGIRFRDDGPLMMARDALKHERTETDEH